MFEFAIACLVLLTLLFILLSLSFYCHQKEGRSLRSDLIERLIWLSGAKKRTQERPARKVEAFIKRARKRNRKPLRNPSLWVGQRVWEAELEGMQYFVWNDGFSPKQQVILYLHGGGYVNPPTIFHYRMLGKLARKTGAKVYFPNYPKLPDFQFEQSYEKVIALYRYSLESVESSEQVVLMGDSAGGGFALGLAMAIREKQLPQAGALLLLSPWLDVATRNPEIKAYESVDPQLSAFGLYGIGLAWAGLEEKLRHPWVSPLFGSLEGLPPISLFVGTHEIFYPDNLKLHQRLEEEGLQHQFIVGEKMNHVYVIFPTPEGRRAIEQLAQFIEKLS